MKFSRKTTKNPESVLFPELSGGKIMSGSLVLNSSAQLYKTFDI